MHLVIDWCLLLVKIICSRVIFAINIYRLLRQNIKSSETATKTGNGIYVVYEINESYKLKLRRFK